MADTEPQQNGHADGKFINSIDPEDPEYIRQMRRPAEVKEDVRQMVTRQRVSSTLNAQMFRDELEEIVKETLSQHPTPANMLALQQITEMLVPQSRFNQSTMRSSSAIPIADIRGVDSMNYTKGEKLLRCKVAAAFRLMDLFGWCSGLNSNMSTRISQEQEHFILNPHGLLFNEITAASLLKVDMQAEVVDTGSTRLTVNKQNFHVNAAIHAARPDIKCVIQLRSNSAVSVSSMKCGILPLNQEAILLGETSSFDYSGDVADQEEADRLTRALGPSNKVLILHNFGILACGATLEEAFLLGRQIMSAVDTQLHSLSVGLDNLILPSEETKQKIIESAAAQAAHKEEGEKKPKWRRGELEFEGLMRHLDNSGYRTGYVYHDSLHRRDPRRDRINSEVEIPPTSSNVNFFYDDVNKSPLKQHMDRQKKQNRTDWLNTPNAYKREEVEETGTPNPKKITKWVEDSDNATAPVKTDGANQFAPQGANPKELSDKHKSIRKDYYTERNTAGPQSKILDGVTYEEANKMRDDHNPNTSDSVIVVGAASKGIIQRKHQNNAHVYKTYYASNPFDSMNEDEIEQYKAEIQRKGGDVSGGDEQLSPGPDGKLISSEERMEQVRSGNPTETITTTEVRPSYLETSLDDLSGGPQRTRIVRTEYHETSIDDTFENPRTTSTPAKPDSGGHFQRDKRMQSARFPERKSEMVEELEKNFERTRSERHPKQRVVSTQDGTMNGQEMAASPTKSTSSRDSTLDERSSREGSPTKEMTSADSPSKARKPKKNKFRIPSFNKKKEKK